MPSVWPASDVGRGAIENTAESPGAGVVGSSVTMVIGSPLPWSMTIPAAYGRRAGPTRDVSPAASLESTTMKAGMITGERTLELLDMPEPVAALDPPSCECGASVRPGVVWFGEALPDEPWERAVDAVASADVLVVVGTSGIVYPAAGLPAAALAQGVPVVEVNPDTTPLSSSATVTIRDTAARALPELLDRLSDLV